ncbi:MULTISPECIES: condensation domain-containing protein [unclassified Streptomyces]|uniref:condensation domain-containing protein n=1 Tax=unclassified Streptomyces TaxID=2593676 RepID=UPI0022B5F660|nr:MULTISPECIES: condensation domain-containing protein [unclassified Streptomyces]MCZ7413947.1 condensation domain-containing protein [Streptomyces sp. WMMC897]MCZ7430943.1 condensation domain-containing protein [Streptomyces sp. WMMC1477]
MSTLERLDLEALLEHLTARDIRLTPDGGLLRYDAPADAAGPALEAALRRHKEPLLAWAAGRPVVLARERAADGAADLALRHSAETRPETWNVAIAMDLRGPLAPEALGSALTALTARHEALRSRFVPAADGVWQEVLRAAPASLPTEDLRPLAPAAREARIAEACAELAGRPFDLTEGTHPRTRLLRLADEEWRLVLVLHHVTVDGRAFSVLLHELGVLYRQAAGDTGVPALPPAPSCVAHARAEAARAPDEYEERRRLAFWARELAAASAACDLPPDRPRPPRLSGRGATDRVAVEPRVREALESFARGHGTTPFAVTLAAAVRMVTTLSGRSEVVLNTSYANRPDPASQSLVSCTATALPLRVRCERDDTFAALCARVHAQLVEGIAHLLPYGRIREGLARHHDLDVPAPLPFSMTYQNTLDTALDLPGLTVELVDLHPPGARRDCTLGFTPLPDGSGELTAEYSTDLYDPGTVRGWLDAWVTLLAGLEAAEPVT